MTNRHRMQNRNAKTADESLTARAFVPGVARAVRVTLIIASLVAIAACSQRAGDLGRQPDDYYTRYVFDSVDRHLLAGGRGELSKLPLSDAEERMYDLLWRFFSAPHASEWSPFGNSRVNPIDLKSGKAFETTDKYYRYLRYSGFQSTRGRYTAMANHITADLDTLPRAFAAVCAVQKIDDQRRTAARAFPELGEEAQTEVEKRLIENAVVAIIFAKAIEYRYESYSYALKRLLVETPDDAAQAVDARLSALAVSVEASERGAYCG